jgi:Rrf2 family transcriptional regulator, nitric oxide-sensitive transcriptional repressor
MRLTVYTDYSLRVLIYVGLKESGLATVGEISDSYGISRNHLTKVVHRLGLLGYLENVRGRKGGIRLAKPPRAINVGKLVRRLEEDMALVQCFDPMGSRCRIERACVLRSTLHEALAAFLAVLDSRTLEDLIAPRRPLQRLLQEERRGTGTARPRSDPGRRTPSPVFDDSRRRTRVA